MRCSLLRVLVDIDTLRQGSKFGVSHANDFKNSLADDGADADPVERDMTSRNSAWRTTPEWSFRRGATSVAVGLAENTRKDDGAPAK